MSSRTLGHRLVQRREASSSEGRNTFVRMLQSASMVSKINTRKHGKFTDQYGTVPAFVLRKKRHKYESAPSASSVPNVKESERTALVEHVVTWL